MDSRAFNADYPWIPREYYAATMTACKMIRQSGWFNKAVRYAASKFNVDEEELEKHVRARQAAGQKGKKRGKMYYFGVVQHVFSEADYEGSTTISAVKGYTQDSVKQRFISADLKYDKRNDTGSVYSLCRSHLVTEPYNTKEEALKAAAELLKGCDFFTDTDRLFIAE